MARARLSETITDPLGNVLAGAAVTVRELGTVTPLGQTMYSARTGGTVLGNPLTSDAFGRIEAYATFPDEVDLYIAAPYRTARTVRSAFIESQDTPPFGGHNDGRRQAVEIVALNNGGQPGPVNHSRQILPEDITYIDVGALAPDLGNFQFAIATDRWIFWLPYGAEFEEDGPSSRMLVYDRSGDREDLASYRVIDLNEVMGLTGTAAKAMGILGGCVDEDGWLYLAPFMEDATLGPLATKGNSLMVRINTRKDPEDPTAYERFDLLGMSSPPSLFGYCGAAVAGPYTFYCPVSDAGGSPGANTHHGQMVRYDRRLPFASPAAWAYYDLTAIHARLKGFQGILLAGDWLYLVPFKWGNNATDRSGRILRYKLGTPFGAGGTWQHYDLEPLNAANVAYDGAVWTGREIVLVPWGSASLGYQLGRAAKFDPEGPIGGAANELSNPSNWEFFDLLTLPYDSGISAENRCRGYQWAWFSYPDCWFVPSVNSVNPIGGTYPRVPPYVKWDCRKPFSAAASWQTLDYGDALSLTTQVLSTGAAFDGVDAWLSPFGSRPSPSAKIAIIHCPRSDPAASDAWASSDAFKNARGYVGFGTDDPGARVHVSGQVYADAVQAGVGALTTTRAVVPTVPFKSAVSALNSGAAETTMQVYLLPANALVVHSGIRIRAWGGFNANANTKTLRLKLGGTTPTQGVAYGAAGGQLLSAFAVTTNGGSWDLDATILHKATNSQDSIARWLATSTAAVDDPHAEVASGTRDATTALPIVVTGQGTSTGDMSLRGMVIEVLG